MAHPQAKLRMSAAVPAGATRPMLNQIATPVMAPKTVEMRMSIVELRRARARSEASRRRTASVSTTAMAMPPPTAKCETRTWTMEMIAMTTPPPIPGAQVG